MLIGHQGVLAAVSGAVTQGKTLFSTRSFGYGLRITSRHGSPWDAVFTDTSFSNVALVSYAVGFPGTISNVQVPYIATNTNASNSVMGPYNLTTGGALYATIPGLSTAPAYNNGSLAVAASDEINWTWYRLAAGTVTVFASIATFAADPGEGHIQLLGTSNTVYGLSSTRYGYFTGVDTGVGSTTTLSASAEIRVSSACVLSRWETQVTSNPRTTNSTIFLKVNGVTVHSFTLTAGTTPTTIATPETVLAAGDRIVWGCTNGTGSGNMNMGSGLTLRNLADAKSDVWSYVDATGYTIASAYYIPILTFSSTNAIYRAAATYNDMQLGYAATLAVPQVYVESNASTVACTIRLLVNGAASGVSITIPVGSGAGWITGTGSVTVTSTDRVVWEALGPVASGGSGALVAPTLGLQIQYLSG